MCGQYRLPRRWENELLWVISCKGNSLCSITKRIADGSRAKEGSVDPLEVPLGPMTGARAKRFKEALHVLIRDAHIEEARVFNSKKETKMVHIIKLNPDLIKSQGIFDFLICCYFEVDLVLICCRFAAILELI